MLEFWNTYPPVKKQLDQVLELLENRLTIDIPDVQEALDNFLHSGGKMLRPALFLLFADLNDRDANKQTNYINVAASLEMLHMATLIHDDIIDDSPLRRGTITVQSKCGKDTAVYAGDFLFTQFFELLIETLNGTSLMAENALTMKQLLLGELGQKADRFNLNQTVENYLHNITGKTARLFELACYEGVHLSNGGSELEKAAGTIGRNIGISFQIYDDILDYSSDAKTLKKPITEDLAQGIYTLPLILARQNHEDEFDQYLQKKQLITEDEVRIVAKMVNQYGGIQQSKQYAKQYYDETITLINHIPASNAKKTIQTLSKKLLDRQY